MKKDLYFKPETIEFEMLNESILCQSAGVGDMNVNDNLDNDSFI